MTAPRADSVSDSMLQQGLLNDAKLTLTWDDMASTLEGTFLRAACRCSQCRFQRHQAGLAIDAPLPLAAGTTMAITGVASMGYGLQLTFSDGHDKGIYPWSYLRDLAMTDR